MKIKKYLGWLFFALLLISISLIGRKPAFAKKQRKEVLNHSFLAKQLLNKYIDNIYESAHLKISGLDFDVFKKGVTGFINLKIGKKIPQATSILTLIDYDRPSRKKRLWIIDLMGKTLILNTWVAHGEGSGRDVAKRFSDKFDSHASSIGFFLTDDVYYGKNGRSLRLDGLDEQFNINARARAIVVHGASYVSQNTIRDTGHLGRSFGCPAVSPKVADRVINTIKAKTVIFINGNTRGYNSKFLDEDMAAGFVR